MKKNYFSDPNKVPLLHLFLIFFTMLPVTMIVPVFKDIIKDIHGGNNFMVSLFMSIAMLGSFLFSPIAGFFSDKFKNRRTFISIFAILDGICFLILGGTREITILQFARFFEGICHIFVIGLLLSSITDKENDNSNPTHYKKGILMGLAGMLLSLGVGIGSPLGILGRQNPYIPIYTASGIMFAIGIISFIYLKDHPIHFHEKVTFAKWKKALSQNKYFLIPYIYNFIDRFTVGFFVTTFNIHLRESLSLNSGQVGFFLAAVLIPMSLLSYPFARLSKKVGTFPLMLAGSFLYGVSLSIAGYLNHPKLILPVLLLCGIGAGVMFVPSMMSASLMAPKGYNASVMSGFTGVGSIGFMLGPLVSVFLENYLNTNISSEHNFGFLSTFFGGLEVLVVLLTFPLYKKMKEASK